MAGQHTMPRLLVYDRLDSFKVELDPSQVVSLVSTEQVNGEHSLTIETTQQLARSDRILIQDAMSIWHEYVVLGDEGTHNTGGAVVHAYYCIWSLQYDLMGTYIDTQVGIVPGHASVPSAARLGMAAALSGTSRWAIGTISVTTQASASFYRRSGWDGLKTVLENWGGELQANITVGKSGVTARTVDLLAHVGSNTAIRRFDYAADIAGIKRTLSEAPMYCRIVPLTKSEQTENGGYTRRKTIADVNLNRVWLQDDAMVDYVKVSDGSGGWEYPTLIVTNDTYEEPSDLKTWAEQHITEYTQPEATYEADVVQFAQAGMNVHGVALGDAVTIVDKTFDGDGLRLSARVIKQVVNLLDPSDIKLTIGTAKATLASQFQGISNQVQALAENTVSTGEYQASAAYLSNLIAELNTQINATGGYTYITQGQGLRTYDVPVADPTSGLEANSVVEIKGGSIRIANSKTSQGEWDWKTVFTSGHIAANLVTAANIVTGFIGSASSGTYIDLDNNLVNLGDASKTHAVITYNAMKLVDQEGNNYVYLSDLRDSTYGSFTYTPVTERYLSTGLTTINCYFTLDPIWSASANSLYTVTVDGVAVQKYTTNAHSYITRSSGRYYMRISGEDAPSGSIIEITYPTNDTRAKAFTLGSRDDSATVGPMSTSIGAENVADGPNGIAIGRALIAHDNQVVVGKYSAEARNYPFVVGNGTSDSNRINVLAVNGVQNRLELYNPLEIAYGGTGTANFATVKELEISSTSTTSGTEKNLGTLSFGSSGTWLVFYEATFATNATGYRYARLGSVYTSRSRVSACSSGSTILNGSGILTGSSISLYAQQNSGSSLSASGHIYAIRLK